MLPSASTNPNLPTRRNGRLQACEPCRKRKMGCDHSLPVCSRCRKRKQNDDCVYLPASPSKSLHGLSSNSGSGTPKRSSNSRQDQALIPPDPYSTAASEPCNTSTTSTLFVNQAEDLRPMECSSFAEDNQDEGGPAVYLRSYNAEASAMIRPSHTLSQSRGPFPSALRNDSDNPSAPTLFSDRSGYLGPSSFSSIFWENQENLGYAGWGPRVVPEADQSPMVAAARRLPSAPTETSIEVLSYIPTKPCCDVLLASQNRWMNIGIKECHERMWEIHGHYIKGGTDKDLEEFSTVFQNNSTKPFIEPEDPQAYIDGFTRSNIRWEALGMLFTEWAFGAFSDKIPERLFTSGRGDERNRKQFLELMKRGAEMCIDLCSGADTVNPLVVNLLYNYCLLTSIFSGDTSTLLWRRNGDLCCAATALGLHRETLHTGTQISLAVQMRRQAFASVFTVDKAIASFTGRPPCLSRRFCSNAIPLDISDDDLMLPNDQLLELARTTLDVNGWNTDGKLYGVTRMRLHYSMSLIRDEILELSLGNVNVQNAVEEILNLKSRAQDTWADFPLHVKYTDGDLEPDRIADEALWSRIRVRIRHLQNLFLIEFLLQKSGFSNGQGLLDIARETLSMVLVIYKHRDRFVDQHFDYEWIVMCYGVPPAGVLCLELLKQFEITPSLLRLPRSETVQNLSVFTAFLDWMPPASGNYYLCQRVKTIISHVLDQVLEGPSHSQRVLIDPQALYDFELPGDSSSWQDLGNVNLWDTLGWANMEWTENTL